MNTPVLSDFLDSLDGVAYATDSEGRIVACGLGNWNQFARANDAPDLAGPEAVVGRSLFDVIAGEPVRVAYRQFMAALAQDRVSAIKFSYRCDGPGLGRAMQMSITRLVGSVAPGGFLFQSTQLDYAVHAPIAILDLRRGWRTAEEDDKGATRLCTFCQRHCEPGGAPSNPAKWTYDAPTAAGDHHVLHTVCPRCQDRCHALVANRSKAPELSRRQRDVLAMLVRGHPNKTICTKLGMSPNTVKTHLRVIFRELQASNRTEAATEALRRWPGCANVDGADPA